MRSVFLVHLVVEAEAELPQLAPLETAVAVDPEDELLVVEVLTEPAAAAAARSSPSKRPDPDTWAFDNLVSAKRNTRKKYRNQGFDIANFFGNR